MQVINFPFTLTKFDTNCHSRITHIGRTFVLDGKCIYNKKDKSKILILQCHRSTVSYTGLCWGRGSKVEGEHLGGMQLPAVLQADF